MSAASLLKGEDEDGGNNSNVVVHGTRRQRLHRFFEDPSSSIKAFYFANFMLTLITCSVIFLCIQTLPEFYDRHKKTWFVLESVIVICFTIEYVFRFYAAPERLKWMVQILNLIDLVAVIPYYVELIIGDSDDTSGLAIIRMLRLVRIFRIFKFSRYSLGFQVVFRTLEVSKDALVLLIFLCFIMMVFFGTLIYYTERGEWDKERRKWLRNSGDPSPFQSIPHTFWYILITLTTVGYGDAFPIQPGGKIIASAVMLLGILVIAFPIAIIGNNFQLEWKKASDEQKAYLIKVKRAASLSLRKSISNMLVSPAENSSSSNNNNSNNSNNNNNNNNNSNNNVKDKKTNTNNVNNNNTDIQAADGSNALVVNEEDDDLAEIERKEEEDRLNEEKEENMTPEEISKLTKKQQLNRIFKFPRQSTAGRIIDRGVFLLIMFSIGAFCFETLPDEYERHDDTWFAIETVVIVLFTAEYLVRLCLADSIWKFIIEPLNIVDLLAVLPYYIEVAISSNGDLSGLGIIRVLRLIRIFRVIRTFRAQFDLVKRTLRKSKDSLLLMLSILAVAVIFFSALEYYCERGDYDEERRRWIRQGSKSPYQSIPHAFWWAIVTMTTVGYGDVYPVTLPGKVVAVFAAFTGILTIAFPVTVITVNFTDEWNKMMERQENKDNEKGYETRTIVAAVVIILTGIIGIYFYHYY